MRPRDAYDAEIKWFRANPDKTEHVRPATVEEQVWMLERTGGAVHDRIRISRSDWYTTEGRSDHAILKLDPA